MNCQICLETYNDTRVKPYSLTPCGHTFCLKCLDTLMSSSDTAKCPKCRMLIKGKIMNFAILDVLDLNLIPDCNVSLKKSIQKSLSDLQQTENKFFPAYEAKLQENKDRIKQLKDEINTQTIDIINQIKQNRISLFKTAEQIETQMNESLGRYLVAQQQVELHANEYTSRLKNLNQYERTELNTFREELDKLKLDFDTNMHDLKSSNFKLEFKKFSAAKTNANFIGEIVHEKPTASERRREKTVSNNSAATISRSVSASRIDKLGLDESSKIERNSLVFAGTAPIASPTKPFFSLALINTIRGTCKVKALCALPNGTLASGTRDGIIRIWDSHKGSVVHTLKGHTNGINCLIALSDEYLASGSTDSTINIWNIEKGVVVKTLTGHNGFIHSLVLLFNGNIASGSDDSTIKIWDPIAGNAIRTLKGHSYTVLCLCVLKNGHLASGSADTTIKIWNTENTTARSLKSLTGHTNSVNSLCLIGDYLASGSNDRTIKIWNPTNGDLVRTLTGHKDYVVSLCPLANNMLASGSFDHFIKIWNVQTGELVKTLSEHIDWVTSLTKTNSFFASASNDETIKIWTF